MKRVRSSNYTFEEKMRLISIIQKYKGTIENKGTGTVIWKKKEAAWKDIAVEFNASATTQRSVEALKMFYKNKKQGTKKYAAVNRTSLAATVENPGTSRLDDSVLDLTSDLMHKETVYGLDNPYDKDAVMKQTSNHITPPALPAYILQQYKNAAELKSKVLKEQLEVLQIEKQLRTEKLAWARQQQQMTEDRKTELHQLKKKLLNLDIEIKQAQLKALSKI